jgi:CRP/FNR family transcriptional regulator
MAKMVKPLENGKERIVRLLLAGEIFGLEALCDSTYPLTCVVLQDSEICSVPRDKFLTFLHDNPDIALKMIRFLVQEMVQLRQQITSMSFKDARGRLATFLLSLVPGEVPLSSGGCQVTLPLTSQEIGELLEISSETVSRAWSALKADGLVQKRGRKVVIQDLPGLEDATRR